MQATGTFEVQMDPLAQDEGEGSTLGLLTLNKQFSGDLEATGSGHMLTALGQEGSAVYVAIERVSGTLGGRSGSFALVHKGTATSSGQELTIEIVPDSGGGQLAGIAGTLRIDVRDGAHFYTIDYTLGD